MSQWVYAVAVLTNVAKLFLWLIELKVKEERKKLILLEEKMRIIFGGEVWGVRRSFSKPDKNSYATKEKIDEICPRNFFLFST